MTLKFGELEKIATDDGFIWYAQLELKSASFEEVPFCLVCKDETGADDETILLAERIAKNIDQLTRLTFFVKKFLIFNLNVKNEIFYPSNSISIS